MNIIKKDQWELCFGDEEHVVEIVRGTKEEVTNYLNALKEQTWEGGCERIDKYINNELEDDSVTIIFLNYNEEVFAVISLDGFKKKLENECSTGEEKELISTEEQLEQFNKLAKKYHFEKGSVEIRDKAGGIIEIEGYFSGGRISNDEIPFGYIKKEIRTSDDDDSVYATLEDSVRVNYGCTFISDNEDLIKWSQGCDFIQIEDWNYESVYVPDESDEEDDKKDEVYNELCNEIDKHGVYVLIKEECRPQLTRNINETDVKSIVVKALFMSNEECSPLKFIDTNDECWDANDYFNTENLRKVWDTHYFWK